MKNKRLLIVVGIVCLALIVAMLPFASACAPKAKPGQVLKIGITLPSCVPSVGPRHSEAPAALLLTEPLKLLILNHWRFHPVTYRGDYPVLYLENPD